MIQPLTADEYRRARLMHVKREVEKLKREEIPPREALHRAAIEALSAVLASFDISRSRSG
jgi:hypothetical protein